MNEVFQSLIGKIQTDMRQKMIETVKAFQSLIGKIQTIWRREKHAIMTAFQSLIGKIQTGSGSSVRPFSSDVSIPHR